MEVVRQLAVFVANRPGTLAEVSKRLSDRGVSVLGLCVADAVDHAVLRLVVDDPATAVHCLEEDGLLVLDTEMIAVRLPNQKGMMVKLSEALARENVNIEYAYGGVGEEDTDGVLYLKVVDLDKARQALSRMGL